MTRLYRDNGYLLSRAVVPPQTIGKDGVVRIQLVEGYVDAIIYEGDVDKLSDHIKWYAQKVKQSRPLNIKDLERYILLIKDLPGVEVKTVLQPSAHQPQASDLILFIKRRSIEGILGINNEGTRYVGPYIANGQIALNSLLGQDDQFTMQGAVAQRTKELKHIHATYKQFIGSEGTKISLGGNFTKVQPGDVLKMLNIAGENKSVDVSLLQPVVRSRAQSLYLGGSFMVRNVDTGLLANAVQSKDKLRIISVRLSWDMADRFRGVNLLNFAVNKGLNGFGSTNNNSLNKSRMQGRFDFTSLNLELSRLQALWGNFSLFGVIESQYAFNPLLSSERFCYGSPPLFKAYIDAPLIGDTGISEKIEFRYGKDQSSGPPFEPSFVKLYQFYVFYGYGTAWNLKASLDDRKRTSAPATGGGIRLVFSKQISLNIEYDRPLKKQISTQKNPSTLFFNLSKKF